MSFANFDFSYFLNQYTDKSLQQDFSKMTNKQLLDELKKVQEFKELVFPNKWYNDPILKESLPEKKCYNTKEFLVNGYANATGYKNYVAKEFIAAKPGGNRPILEAPEVPAITIIQNSFSDANEPKDQTVS